MDNVNSIIEERGIVYGDPEQSHRNIGLSWTALLQQHYSVTLEHPLPASLVAQMMVTFKMQRAARVFHADNYLDAHAYAQFAEVFQRQQSSTVSAPGLVGGHEAGRGPMQPGAGPRGRDGSWRGLVRSLLGRRVQAGAEGAR